MENNPWGIAPHPQLLEFLFAFKSNVSAIFREVLGIHEIDHLSITRVTKNNKLITFSSTPAMEFNLFNGPLWRYDKSYSPEWFNQCTQAPWQSLYNEARYDELYYLKQVKHAFPIGLTLAATLNEEPVIYSLASRKSCPRTQDIFTTQQEDFYRIGQYCLNLLSPLLISCDTATVPYSQTLVDYATSK